MGVRMTKAYYVPWDRVINVKEAEHFDSMTLKGNLRCPSCNARLRFVPSFQRVSHDATVASYFGLVADRQTVHSDECPYSLVDRSKTNVSKTQDLMRVLDRGQHEFRLQLLDEALDSSEQADEGAGAINDYPLASRVTHGVHEIKVLRLATAQRLVALREALDRRPDIAERVVIRFEGQIISWGDFYFQREQLIQCFHRVRKYQNPVCIEGVVKQIKLPSPAGSHITIQLKSPKLEHSTTGIPVVRLKLLDGNLAEPIRLGSKIAVFGKADVQSNCKDGKCWLNIFVHVTHRQQLHVISS